MARKRIALAQNCFRDRRLVASVVASTGFCRSDVVVEIGAGEGIITEELARVAGRVIGVEKDRELVRHLAHRFRATPNVRVVHADFLEYEIEESEYQVLGNIPFNATAAIMRKLLDAPNPPGNAVLVVQREAAEKVVGEPARTLFSVLHYPWFRARILREFARSDFYPMPSVDVVLLHVVRRSRPLVSAEHACLYEQFVRFGFEAWKHSLKTTFKPVFSYPQWKRLRAELLLRDDATPGEVTGEQWVGMFRWSVEGVTVEKREAIATCEGRHCRRDRA